jgi:hypothetical protein
MPLSSPESYASFLIRMQRTHSGASPTWIISMRSTKTGELHWFPSLDALVAFLQKTYGPGEAAHNASKPRAIAEDMGE